MGLAVVLNEVKYLYSFMMTASNLLYMKKVIFKMISALCLAALLTSCGSARRSADDGRGRRDGQAVPADTVEKRDTFVPLHPPVVVPHSWRDRME